METYSIHKGAQIAPRKARMTLDLIRGKNVSQALNSAVANAVNNFGAKREDLVIKETYINEGRTLKRRKAASHSRVAKNYHRTSHIYVCVTDNMTEKED